MKLVCRVIILVFLGTSLALAQTTPFQHVIVIFQENRTPDNLFNDPNLIAAGADIQTWGINSKGQKINFSAQPLATTYDLGHSHKNFLAMYDGGKMDGADLITCTPNAGTKCPANPQFAYADNSDHTMDPYFQLAEQYGFGDRMFSTHQGDSYPGHQFIIGGTSAPTEFSELFASSSPNMNGKGVAIGCTAPSGEYVKLVSPSGLENQTTYPCFERPTLIDVLNGAGITWKYYTPLGYSMFTAPNSIRHLCVPNNGVCTGADFQNNVVLNSKQILTDIGNCNLSQVNWVMPTAAQSDHPSSNKGLGPSWVASIVNAIGNSTCNPKYWSNTAILVTWDDWGGWYDHVPPFRIGQTNGWGTGYAYGFRVPLVVVSAYTPNAYISKLNHDFGSVLKFIEYVFGDATGPLGPIPPGIYADAYADNLFDFFDFHQSPRVFKTIQAPRNAEYFINDTSPPEAPDTD